MIKVNITEKAVYFWGYRRKVCQIARIPVHVRYNKQKTKK
jgi:hypothetical protein